MKSKKNFMIIIVLIICAVVGRFIYKNLSTIQIQNDAADLEINTEEIEKMEWRESEASKLFKVLPDPNEEGEPIDLTWTEVWEDYDRGHYNKEPVNIDKLSKFYINSYSDVFDELSTPELTIGVEFEGGRLNNIPYWLYEDEPMYYSLSESDMEQIKVSLKNHIYRHDWKYEYDNTLEEKDVYATEIDTDYAYTVVLVDDYGRMEVYEGYGRVPKDFEDFLNEMKVYDPLFDELSEEDK